MDPRGWGEIVLTLAVTVALAWPLGAYMARVWQGQSTAGLFHQRISEISSL